MLGCHDTIESLTSQVYYKAVLIYVRLSWYNWKFDINYKWFTEGELKLLSGNKMWDVHMYGQR
jgi:hypothetical protein